MDLTGIYKRVKYRCRTVRNDIFQRSGNQRKFILDMPKRWPCSVAGVFHGPGTDVLSDPKNLAIKLYRQVILSPTTPY
jgi:hypothetical protein